MAKKEQTLEDLKQKYKILQEKYSLPSFESLNEDFVIEKAYESETDLLLREIRKFIWDRIGNYLRLIEGILNPVNAPMFIFSIVKILGIEEKKKLSEIYKELTKLEIRVIAIDLDYDEKKEAEFVNNAYSLWQKIKKDLVNILEKICKKWDDKSENSNKCYFG